MLPHLFMTVNDSRSAHRTEIITKYNTNQENNRNTFIKSMYLSIFIYLVLKIYLSTIGYFYRIWKQKFNVVSTEFTQGSNGVARGEKRQLINLAR